MNIKINNIMRSLVIFVFFAVCLCPLYGQSKEFTNLQEIIAKALDGDASYQSKLVDYYYNTTKNYMEAVRWCKIMAENSNAKENNKEYANYILGICAYYGRCSEKSIKKAITWWKRGVENKSGRCAWILAYVYVKDLKDSIEAIKWYKRSAELKNKEAAYFLAQLYENGFETSNGTNVFYPNVDRNISQAEKYYAIYLGEFFDENHNNSKLLYKLAKWNYFGEGNLPQNYTRALGLFISAIKYNDNCKEEYKLSTDEECDALWKISICYRFGRGVEKDELTARRYVKKAAEKGNKNAKALLNE